MAKKNQATEGLKKTLGGTKRDDRQAGDKFTFEPITIDVKNALTVIYMLKSPEDNIVLRGVASLEKFARKASENLQLLTSLGIFEYLLPLLHHSDYVIKRFSQKLIGMLSSLEEFRDQMFTIENVLGKMVEILEKENDMVMHEYSALTLAELTKDCQAAENFLRVEKSVDILFLRITSPDPDVQKNCLDIMTNLLNDVQGIDYFLESPSFDMRSFMILTSSSFPAIQLQALQVLNQLTGWNTDTRVLFAFRDALGIETMISILENQDWKDLHAPALDIINNVGDNPKLCDYLLQTGCLAKCVNILDGCGKVVDEGRYCVEKLLGVLARISQNEAGRAALHFNRVENHFIRYLGVQGWDKAQESAVFGVAHMCLNAQSLNYIMENNPIPQLADILTDAGKSWSLRHLSAYALNILAHNDRRTCVSIRENERHQKILKMLKNDLKIPAETCTNIINIFTGLSVHPNCRSDIIDENLISSLLECIQNSEEKIVKAPSVQLAALECLSKCLIEMTACKILTDSKGTEKIIGCLKSRYASIRQWAVHIVVQVSQNPDFVKIFIQSKGLQWLLQKKDYKFSVPSWELAINAIFQKYLPAKFAYLGHLDVNDITDEGFYIQRYYRKEFLVLDDLLKNKMSPIKPIYVAHFRNLPQSKAECALFQLPGSQKSAQKYGDTYEKQSANESSIKKVSHNSSPAYEFLSDKESDDLLKAKYGKTAPDPYLPEYLEKLKKKLIRENTFKGNPKWFSMHPNFIKERARVLAEFVADQMAGPDPHQGCNHGYLEMHLNDIKLTLGTNIIPLGYIRYGLYTERAMLFKILADKIGLPCALVRGSYGRSWVEISIPVLSTQQDNDIYSTTSINTSCLMSDQELDEKLPSKPTFSFLQPELHNPLPNKLLKPNAIVDLITEPGKILPLCSYEADVYRGIYQLKKCE